MQILFHFFLGGGGGRLSFGVKISRLAFPIVALISLPSVLVSSDGIVGLETGGWAGLGAGCTGLGAGGIGLVLGGGFGRGPGVAGGLCGCGGTGPIFLPFNNCNSDMHTLRRLERLAQEGTRNHT